MASESTILGVRADEVRAGDEVWLMGAIPRQCGWHTVSASLAQGRHHALECGRRNGWVGRSSTPMLVRRSAPSPSGAEEVPPRPIKLYNGDLQWPGSPVTLRTDGVIAFGLVECDTPEEAARLARIIAAAAAYTASAGAGEGVDATTRAILQDAKEVIAGLRRAHPAYHLGVAEPTGVVARSHVVEADIDATLDGGSCRACGGAGHYSADGFFGTEVWHQREVDCAACPPAGAQEETPEGFDEPEWCECDGPRLDLTRCSMCDRRFPPSGSETGDDQ